MTLSKMGQHSLNCGKHLMINMVHWQGMTLRASGCGVNLIIQQQHSRQPQLRVVYKSRPPLCRQHAGIVASRSIWA